jgi:hypothetical protein
MDVMASCAVHESAETRLLFATTLAAAMRSTNNAIVMAWLIFKGASFRELG